MNLDSVTTLLGTSRHLAASRWRQLATAIGLTALLGAVLWFLLIKVAGGIGGDPSAEGGMPSKGGIFLSLTIAWAILVSAFVVPMAASTAAIADDGDDSTLGWTGAALRSLPWMWLRLAIPTLPLLLLGLWAVNDLFGALSDLAASMESAAAGGAAEPSEPTSFRVAELLFGSAPARWAVFSAILGLWFMWSATRATGQDDGALPHAPWRMFGRNPLIVAALAGISAVVLGPLLGKALSSLGGGLGSMTGAAEGGGDGASTMAVLVVGMVISAFIGMVAIPWIALFTEDDGFAARRTAASAHPGSGIEPGLDAAAHAGYATTAAAAAPAQAQAPLQGVPAAVHKVIDQTHVAAPGIPAGAWWYLQAGAQVMVQVAAGHDTTSVSPIASDAAGAWLDMHATGQPGAAAVVVPLLGWYLLGAWNAGTENAQVTMRFTLPMDAQPAPVTQDQHAAG